VNVFKIFWKIWHQKSWIHTITWNYVLWRHIELPR
jgi:hypothetical protein